VQDHTVDDLAQKLKWGRSKTLVARYELLEIGFVVMHNRKGENANGVPLRIRRRSFSYPQKGNCFQDVTRGAASAVSRDVSVALSHAEPFVQSCAPDSRVPRQMTS
jgi:hypothetical protein